MVSDWKLMLNIVFDIFDTNGDGKISQLDLFKLMHNFCKGPSRDSFVSVLYQDICQLSKKMSLHLALKDIDTGQENLNDPLYV